VYLYGYESSQPGIGAKLNDCGGNQEDRRCGEESACKLVRE
jgi:hypothetical protein